MSLRAIVVVALCALVLVDDTWAVDCDHVCPDSYWGQWDTTHWYSGQLCQDDQMGGCAGGGFYFATSTDLKDLGVNCATCYDPITKRENKGIARYMWPRDLSKAAGKSDNDHKWGNFYRPSLHIVVDRDFVVTLTKSGQSQHFRVLKLINDEKPLADQAQYIAAQLEAHPGNSHATVTGVNWVIDTDDTKRARITAYAGGQPIVIHALGKDPILIP